MHIYTQKWTVMYNYPLSMTASLIALALIVCSYFISKKILYLILQGIGIVFLILSYLFVEEYFAMISLSIGLGRTVVYFVYEKKNKNAPIVLAFLISALTISSYFIVNLWILKTAKLLDIIYLISLCFYAFTFRIRNLKTMMYVVIIPTALAVIYNVAITAPIFSILSYSFELTANLFAIVKMKFCKKKEDDNNSEMQKSE